MPVAVKGFQKGDPNINRNGAPKKQFRRDDFTDEIFVERKPDLMEVIEVWFTKAKTGERWAIEKVIDIFLTRPKNRDEADANSNTNTVVTLSQLHQEKLVRMRDILLEDDKEEG